MKKALVLLLIMLAAAALTAFLFRHDIGKQDTGPFVAIAGLLAIIWLGYGVPPVTRFIEKHRRGVFWLGVILAAGSILGLIANIAYDFPFKMSEADQTTFTFCMMCAGIALMMIPRGIPALRRAEAEQEARKSRPAAPKVFRPIGAGVVANALILQHFGAFLRIFGPWLLLIWLTPLAAFAVAAHDPGANPGHFFGTKVDGVVLLLGSLLPLYVIAGIGVPAALVAWHRFVADGTMPRFPITMPGRAAMRYLWRLWMIMVVFGVIMKVAILNGPDLARLLHMSDARLVTTTLFWAVIALEIILAAPMSLVLAAVALGEKDFRGSDSLNLVWHQRFPFSVGFVFALAPFLALCVGVVLLSLSLSIPPMQQFVAGSLTCELLIAMALASCAAYATRAYTVLQKAKAAPQGQDAQTA